MDERLLKAFPRARGILVEKPVSAADPLTTNCQAVARLYKEADVIVSVGYMLRYLKTVQMMKEIMRDNNIVPLFINARYIMAYEHACKLAWWDKDRSCGPVVEQATHFVDLIRYLAGSEAVTSSVTTHTVEHDEEAGRLSKLSFDELQIEAEKRVPRLTVATWKHRRGTVASLCHGIALHASTYSTEIDIIADGWILRLVDAYTPSPSLFVTRPGQASPELIRVEDDPFESEFRALVGAIKEANKDDDRILSPYDDALETYELTWLIRRAGERAVR
jgi:predicted dehydrogenase